MQRDSTTMTEPDSMKRPAGWTLLELVVVVTIVAVLAALVIPGVTAHLRQSRRVEVKSLISELQLFQERWRAEHPEYAPGDEPSLARLINNHASTRWYLVTVDEVSASGYRIHAKATGDQIRDQSRGTSCESLSVTLRERLPKNCW